MNNRNLFILLWVIMIDSIGWGMAFSVLSQIILPESSQILTHASPALKSMVFECLLAIYCLAMFFCAPVLGGLSDQLGRRPILLFAMGTLTTSFCLSAWAASHHHLVMLFIARLVGGISAGSVSVAQASIVDMSSLEKKPFYLSILLMMQSAAFAVAPLLSGYLSTLYPNQNGLSAFLFCIAVGLMGFLLVLLLYKETYFPKEKSMHLNLKEHLHNFVQAFSIRPLGTYLNIMLIATTAFAIVFSDIPVLMHQLFSAAPANVNGLLSFCALCFSASQFITSRFIHRFNQRTFLLRILLLAIVCYASLIALHPNLIPAQALIALVSGLTGILLITLITLASNSVSEHWQGKVMGVISAIAAVNWGIGPLAAGGLSYLPTHALFIVAALGLIACLKLAFAIPTSNQSST